MEALQVYTNFRKKKEIKSMQQRYLIRKNVSSEYTGAR